MYRHGDVLIAPVGAIPKGAARKPQLVLAHGEVTGHSHRIDAVDAARLFEHEGMLYLEVLAETARVLHEEHQPIDLPRGTYRVWRQREYTPQRIVTIRD